MSSVLTLKSPLFQYSLYMRLQQIQMCHLRKVVARSGPSSPSSYAKWFWIRILYIIIYWVQNLYSGSKSSFYVLGPVRILCTGPHPDFMYGPSPDVMHPVRVNVYFFRIIFILTRKNIIIINIPQSKYYVIILPYP